MKRYNKLIFVDDDDNSRAPMAKIIMRSKYLLGPMEVESRGLVVLFPEPMNQKAEAVLISNGYHVADHVATAGAGRHRGRCADPDHGGRAEG